MMEDEAFQDIINMAAATDSASKTINVKLIKTKIYKEANKIREKISVEVKHKMISLKLDSATCLERKFVGVNIQYILNAKIVVRNLAVLEVHERQTSSFLKDTIEQILSEFMIDLQQIYCICTDNGSNMIKMVKLMGGSYVSEDRYDYEQDEEDTETDENDNEEVTETDEIFSCSDINVENFISNDRTFKVRGMLCAAHTLQLAVKDALNSDPGIQVTIAMAKHIVNVLRKPNNANLLRRANLKKPIKDCNTRWTSTYDMLLRLVNLKDICTELSEVNEIVSGFFWDEIKELLKCLEPANDATLILQKEQLTIGDFYITWLNCKNNIAAIEHSFAVALHTAMTNREAKLMQNDVVIEAIYLDSRLNVLLSSEQNQKAKKLLKEVYVQSKHLRERDTTLYSEDSSSEIDNTEGEPIPSTSSGPNFSTIEAMLQSKERLRGNMTQNTSFDICLHELSVAPRINLNENIINHWQNKAVIFSDMANVANIVLGAPATQVSVERLFSSLKFILHPLRSNISPMFLNSIMLVRENKDLL